MKKPLSTSKPATATQISSTARPLQTWSAGALGGCAPLFDANCEACSPSSYGANAHCTVGGHTVPASFIDFRDPSANDTVHWPLPTTVVRAGPFAARPTLRDYSISARISSLTAVRHEPKSR